MFSYFLLLLIYVRSDFEVDGFTYHVIDSKIKSVQVVKCSISESTLIIPPTVSYESFTYTVFSIASEAFSSTNSKQFKIIYLPYTLINIENRAFSWFNELHSIGFINENNEFVNDTLPPQITKINEYVFSHCEVITTIDVNNVIELGTYCFQYCFQLTDIILRKVEIIGEFSLYLTKIGPVLELPSTLKEIHDHAFVETPVENLTGNVPKLELINGAFVNCEELSYIPNLPGLSRLENFAFSGCYKLKEFHCGPKLTLIPTSCFNGCNMLGSFTTESKNYSISTRAFCVCSSLKTFNFEGVFEVFENAFEACSSFVEIDMSKSYLEEVLPIFQDCGNLSSVILPQNLVRFDLSPFEECNIHSFTFSGTKETLDLRATFFECQFDLYEVIFAPSCKVNLDSTFASCYHLSRVVLPKTSYELPHTFAHCYNLTQVENLEFCILLEHTFFSCEKLTKLDSFPSIKTIGLQTFMNCKSLESIPSISSVEVVSSKCFSNCLNLQKFECGSELKSIGSDAFFECNRLESFTTSSLSYAINDQAFQNCFALKSFDFSHCNEIQFGAFDHCTSLFEIDLSKSGFTSLSSNTFSDCSSLQNVVFQPNLECIDNMCFYNCVNITSLHFSSLKCINTSAFEGCISLEKIVFENQPLVISYHAFHSCISLESVELTQSDSNSLASIENGAFENCTSLKSFQFNQWMFGSIGEYAFYGCPLSKKLKFKGGSDQSKLTIFSHAFSSSIIQSIDLRFGFASFNLDMESFSECKEIKCVMISKDHISDISNLFDNKIINGRQCPNYLTTHIGVLVAIILVALAIFVLIIVITVCIIKKKQQNPKLKSEPLITTQ